MSDTLLPSFNGVTAKPLTVKVRIYGRCCTECGLPITRIAKKYTDTKLAHAVSLGELLSTCLRLNVSVTHLATPQEIPING